MKLSLSGLIPILCVITTTAGYIIPDIDLYGPLLGVIDMTCHALKWAPKAIPFMVPKIDKVFFELRTPCSRKQYRVSEANLLLESPDFDVTKKTVVFVSGWHTDLDLGYITELTQAYLCRGGHNMIVVNTSDFIKTFYITSAYNTGELGRFIAIGLKNLKIPGKEIHLIGHSLGAHIVGSAGRNFALNTGDKIGRITGLDPARPCFVETPAFPRLGKDDASFVDIIHSNPNEAGIEEAIGHVDFYPGGLKSTQPSCDIAAILCSHIMSIKYYVESVYSGNENNFIGKQCPDSRSIKSLMCIGTKTPMGFDADGKAKGVYVLDVKDVAPYGTNAKPNTSRKSQKCGICEKKKL